jgi:hypothetical protein
MSNRTLLISLAASTLLWACGDVMTPSVDTAEVPLVATDGTLHHLQWNTAPSPAGLTVDGVQPQDAFLVDGLAADAEPSPIKTYEVSFTAVRGQHSYVEIDYTDCPPSISGDEDGEGKGTACPFLRFDVPSGALWSRPDGSLIGWRDSVLITVSVSSSQILVYLEPSGLQFNPRSPATLTIWYGGADPDFNGDGVVDHEDERIERELLKLWYQKEYGGPWHEMVATHSVAEKRFTVNLLHFSGYAVSW